VTLVVGDRRERRPALRGRDAAEQVKRFLHAVVHVDEWRRVEHAHERSEAVVDPVGAREVAQGH
jgi:hypothetical protein